MTETVTTERPDDQTAADQGDTERMPDDHFDDIDDGCGCAEVWEHLSEERE